MLCALLTVQFSLAIRSHIRTSLIGREVDNGDVRIDLCVFDPLGYRLISV